MKATMWYYCHKCYVEHMNTSSAYKKHRAYADLPKLVMGNSRVYWDNRYNDQHYKNHLSQVVADSKADYPIDNDGMVILSRQAVITWCDGEVLTGTVLIDGKQLADALRACKV